MLSTAAKAALLGCALLLLLQGVDGRNVLPRNSVRGDDGTVYVMKGIIGKWTYREQKTPEFAYWLVPDDDSGKAAKRTTYTEAKTICASMGAYPTTAADKHEHAFLISMTPNNRHGFWVGTVLRADGTDWKNVDGTPWGRYTPWAESEPNYLDGEEHCVFSGFNKADPSRYNDAVCSDPHVRKRIICKKSLRATTVTTTTVTATTVTAAPYCHFPGFVKVGQPNRRGARNKQLKTFGKGAISNPTECFDECSLIGPRCTHFAFKAKKGATCILYKGLPSSTVRGKHYTAYVANPDCKTHTTCGPGTFTAVAGTSAAQPDCNDCSSGTFKPGASTSSIATDTCTAHTKCAAGTFTAVAGTTAAQPDCNVCASGTFKPGASTSSTATDTCTRKKDTCPAGILLHESNDATEDNKCTGRECPLACNPLGAISWTITGETDAKVTPVDNTVRIDFVDSNDSCSQEGKPTSSGPGSGGATATVNLATATQLEVLFSGTGEQNFESISITINGVLLVSYVLNGNDAECTSLGICNANDGHGQYKCDNQKVLVNMQAGANTITISATTQDAIAHRNAFFAASFVPLATTEDCSRCNEK